jgi:hypothetical protein
MFGQERTIVLLDASEVVSVESNDCDGLFYWDVA